MPASVAAPVGEQGPINVHGPIPEAPQSIAAVTPKSESAPVAQRVAADPVPVLNSVEPVGRREDARQLAAVVPTAEQRDGVVSAREHVTSAETPLIRDVPAPTATKVPSHDPKTAQDSLPAKAETLPPIAPAVTVATLAPKRVPAPGTPAADGAPSARSVIAAPVQAAPTFMSPKVRRRELDRMIGELENFYLEKVTR